MNAQVVAAALELIRESERAGTSLLAPDCPESIRTLWAALGNATINQEVLSLVIRQRDALLAVAKAADGDICRGQHTAMDDAIAELDRHFPGWREWQP